MLLLEEGMGSIVAECHVRMPLLLFTRETEACAHTGPPAVLLMGAGDDTNMHKRNDRV